VTERRASLRLPARCRQMLFSVQSPDGATLAYGMLEDTSPGGARLLTARVCRPGPAVLVPLSRHPLAGRSFPFLIERSGPLKGGGAYIAGPFTPPVTEEEARSLAEQP
jgi:hypothetical protein